MSLVAYNGITLPYSNSVSLDQTVVNDPSGTDYILTRFDISYQGVIHWQYLGAMLGGGILPNVFTTQSPAEIMNYIRKRLMIKRQELSLKYNGAELIPFDQILPNETIDSKNGPDPQSCTITQLTNTSWLLNYHVVAHYWENPTTIGGTTKNKFKGTPILSNRWTESVDITKGGASVVTREGRFMMRSDNIDGKGIDEYRYAFAVVGLRRGFIRRSARYAVSEDGLTLSYNIVDEEIYRLPPIPAYEAHGDYFETSPKKNAIRHLGVRLLLKARFDVFQAQLLNTAVSVATNKLYTCIGLLSGRWRGIQESFDIRCSMYENEVEVNAKAIINATSGRAGAFWHGIGAGLEAGGGGAGGGGAGGGGAPAFNRFTAVPGFGGDEANRSSNAAFAGTARQILRAAAYFDPSLATALNADHSQTTPGTEPGKVFAEGDAGGTI